MKFNCGPSPETKRKRKEHAADVEHLRLINWHPFFALRPRRIGENDCRWLEQIERKGTRVQRSQITMHGILNYWTYEWQYRAKQDNAE